MNKVVVGFLVALLATGCAYRQGTEVTEQQRDSFQVGVATVSDVETGLGAPQDIQKSGDEIHYVYEYQEINSFGPSKNEQVRFVFDARTKKLERVVKGQGSMKNPLAG